MIDRRTFKTESIRQIAVMYTFVDTNVMKANKFDFTLICYAL